MTIEWIQGICPPFATLEIATLHFTQRMGNFQSFLGSCFVHEVMARNVENWAIHQQSMLLEHQQMIQQSGCTQIECWAEHRNCRMWYLKNKIQKSHWNLWEFFWQWMRGWCGCFASLLLGNEYLGQVGWSSWHRAHWDSDFLLILSNLTIAQKKSSLQNGESKVCCLNMNTNLYNFYSNSYHPLSSRINLSLKPWRAQCEHEHGGTWVSDVASRAQNGTMVRSIIFWKSSNHCVQAWATFMFDQETFNFLCNSHHTWERTRWHSAQLGSLCQ